VVAPQRHVGSHAAGASSRTCCRWSDRLRAVEP
jgi:hypothetical protein